MQKINLGNILKNQVVYWLMLLILFNACNIQKRRYSNGFYVQKGSHPKAIINHNLGEPEQTHTIINATEKGEDLRINEVTDSLEAINHAILVKDKLPYYDKKGLKFITDTTKKNLEKKAVEESSNKVKPKMELFSKLALIAILINIAMIISIAVLAIFFTAPEVVIALIIFSLFAPAFSLLPALESKYKISKNIEKYKWPNMANVIIIIAAWMFIISLFYMLIFAFVAGITTAGW